ncbi:MAG: isoprenyl transferase [Prosthecochloris sp.]|uniref:Isoprenyl transferase n=1 Tax=Prosthecochloris aestuarii (strain DSM 271 / SK 413) TaxID=290512 RepID=B4S4W0_PROA2|nr:MULTISPECIES: isoprenyl transferase [Prosthecochloris]ACF45458.1 undecaprenyl diphosphate synthase [Prosthecochloris aestuarii DSM 271]MCW8798943.1 isoprenyl transferase [Prosthecochloris sp.]NEX12422.1 isoprenyl transferase [Prosthecochloris sp.]RDD31016.1 isoprenyl transferase [Prosthecochloris sp. ZM]
MDFSTSLTPHWFKTTSNSEDSVAQQDLKLHCQLPRHIAVIMDGNGRWAKENGKSRIEGHIAGVESVRDIVEACAQLQIAYLTLFTFSTENWKRPEKEISALMQLLIKVLRKEAIKLHENNIRLHVIGNIERLPEKVQQTLNETIALTAKNTGLTLSIALSYSGKWDILQACRKIAEEAAAGALDPKKINEQLIESYLSTRAIPDPELLIRTSGELRISNFLLWQSAYSEIFFTRTYWPEFRRKQLYEAIRDFSARERRFGLTSEQLKDNKAR